MVISLKPEVKTEREKHVIEIGRRKIPLVVGPKPELKENEKLIANTLSLCPECYRRLRAVVFERDGKVFIRKICPEHGEFEEVYWGDAELYRKALKYAAPPLKVENVNIPKIDIPCPFNCGICPLHKNQTALANIVLTNRCDISCWYCFFFAERAGYVYEPSIDTLRNMIRTLRKQGPWHPNAVQLTGGEPTLRDDLVDIVKMMKEEGITHIQLNTNGLKFAKLWFTEGPDAAIAYTHKLREAGVNTVYLSFDGVTPKTNPKNHWEMPYILETFRRAGMTSAVFVPVVIKGVNTHELGDIIDYAARNMDVVRGVNFQPVSLVGSMPRKERNKYRVTIPDVIKMIEEQTDGMIGREAWYPVPFTYVFSDFVEAITKKPTLKMTNHPACGAATYVFPEFKKVNGKRVVEDYIPITDFVDIDGLYYFLKEKAEQARNGKSKWRIYLSFAWNIRKFIHRERTPTGLNLRRILLKIIRTRSYSALGEFHYRVLYLGMMHFQDLYNYDIARVERCNIHYLTPDGRIIPFCAFNVMPDLYRDYIQKKYSISFEEYARMKGPDALGPKSKYIRDIKKLVSTEIYQKSYEPYKKKYGY